MHEHAEHGVAAHWAYKGRAKGYAGVSAGSDFEAQVAEARKAVLRQLLAWERDFVERRAPASAPTGRHFDDRIYVFTPQAAVMELPPAPPGRLRLPLHATWPPLPRRQGRRQMVPLNTRWQEQPDRRDQCDQGGRALARLAQCRARLPQSNGPGPRYEPGSTHAGAATIAAAARQWRTAAARGPHGDEAR